MKSLIALTLLFAVSHSAYADKILSPGETYTSRFAGERVACDGGGGGGGGQPDQYDFVTQARVNHDEDWQGHSEGNAMSMCEGNGQAQIFFSTSVQKLQRDGTAECLRYYRNCKQLGETQGSFISKSQNGGKYGCYLRVTIRGTR